MSKLGRLRLDTLKDIGREDKKKRTRKAKNPSNVFKRSGDKVLIVSNYDGLCVLCRGKISIGHFVWFDHTKPVGQKAVHKECWTPKEDS